MTGLAREVAVAAVALGGYIPCATARCGRWGRTCGGCRRRRYSPLILRAKW